MTGAGSTGRNIPNRRAIPAAGSAAWFLSAALLAAAVLLPPAAAAFFSLPTGPSEKGEEVSGVPAAPKTFPGTVPAGVKILADREFQDALGGEIAAARSEITICAYLFAAKETLADRPRAIVDRLAEAVSRGVKVEVILEVGRESAAVTRANREAARMLARRGVKVSVDGSGSPVHARFVVIDRRLVFLGSHDLTENSLGKFREASLLVDSPALAATLLGRLESFKLVPYAEASPRSPVRSRPTRPTMPTRPTRHR